MNKSPLTVSEKLSKAKIVAGREFPFWGMLIMACEFVSDPGCKTMWADGKRIGYDPAFVEACQVEELAWTLAHEAMHNAFGHVLTRGARDPKIHNYATDYWINGTLWQSMKSGNGGDQGRFKEPDLARILQSPGATVLRDARFDGMGSDEIYAILVRELDPKKGGGGAQGKPGPGGQDGNFSGDLNYDEARDQGHSDSAVARDIAEYWKGQVAGAAAAAKKMGKLPGGFERYVDELLNPTVPWQETLQHFVQPNPADYTFAIPDRRFLEEDFILPDRFGEELLIVVAVDTSGSVSGPELQQYIGDTAAILRSFETVSGLFIGCDAAVHDCVRIGPEDPVPSRIGGGGGTDFRPVFKRVEEEDFEPHCLIYFTDGHGSFPSEAPKYPVIWLVVNSEVQPPFGETIYVKTH